MNACPSLRLEGGLFSPDLLEALARADLPGQKPQDFGLPPRRALTEEIAAVYHDARALWQVFQHRLERLHEGDLATSETRDSWVIPFLRLLGYDLHFQPRALDLDGLTFAISHLLSSPLPSSLSPLPSAFPVHIVGYRQELGRLAPSGRPRLSPHALVQEYLNRSEALWGLVTNGRTLRLLRNSTFVRRQAYVEFDLEGLFEEERFADFVLLYRLLHRTRLPGDGRPEDCLLEQYYQQALEQGGRVREHLREGVERCLTRLANGFLCHPDSTGLRNALREREAASSSPALALYRQLLHLVYRLLFLLVSEERGLMGQNPLYLESYGITRLRRLTENRAACTEDVDLWLGLRALWATLADEQLAAFLGIPPLNGELFTHQALDEACITNRDLLTAFSYLAFYDSPPRRVNYAALDTEELGSVYESLLDYHPAVTFDAAGRAHFELAPGSERKSTGSYYTPPQLVNELVRSALEPVIEERLAQVREAIKDEKESALLSIKVCDPACGSGHFLLAAARRLGKELARVRTGEDEPAPEQMRAAVRDVVAHCIYGVDKNPLAVELARVALWLESHAEGKPLTFLEHRLKCGDSLVGVFDLSVLEAGLPDEAFAPLAGDDKKLAASLKRQNQAEREGQLTLFDRHFDFDLSAAVHLGEELDAIPDDSPEQVRRKRARYEARQSAPDWRRQKEACDLWTAAFFQEFRPRGVGGEGFVTTETVRNRLAGRPVQPQVLAQAIALADEGHFFHWPLEFPEVFVQGGFDIVLGNPPWDQIQFDDREFFQRTSPHIANAENMARRKEMIENLKIRDADLYQHYKSAQRQDDCYKRFIHLSGRFPLTSYGRLNLAPLFAEQIRHLLNKHGRAGIIVPTGIATDAFNQFFFADLVEKGQIVSLFDFENREGIFPGVHRSYKFCLLTLSGEQENARGSSPLTLSFFATRAEHLRDPRRIFSLTRADIARINPNTRTLPVFRTRQDADLTRAIYARVPVLVNEALKENPWDVRFKLMFMMNTDSHLFRTRQELERTGWQLQGHCFVRGEETYLPLYEAKMIWHFDHRFGTYDGVSDRASTHLPTPDARQHADPNFLILPWYWVDAAEVRARLGKWQHGWLLGFRDVTNATNERTAIFSLLPRVGVGN
ncbi:MAG TPA: N-6 DNA methylase, partial [Anaerolineae bacterium]|nr:N-6 DNA methylase [Anaerolineae bacterium]